MGGTNKNASEAMGANPGCFIRNPNQRPTQPSVTQATISCVRTSNAMRSMKPSCQSMTRPRRGRSSRALQKISPGVAPEGMGPGGLSEAITMTTQIKNTWTSTARSAGNNILRP